MQMTIRFIHTSDWQLGMTRHFLSEEAQARFSQARIDAVAAIGRIARETGSAFVVVAGDVFETNQVDPRTVRRACEAMAAIPCPVFLLPGNHDPLDAGSVFRTPTFERARPANVTLLEDGAAHPVLPGVEVIGAPWSSKRPLSDLVAAACAGLAPDPGVRRVLVAHGSTDEMVALDNPAAISVSAAEAALADGRIAYLALGDRHSTTEIGRTGRIRYSGAPEPTDYDELDPGNVLVVELDERDESSQGGCRVEKRATGTWRFLRERFELGGRTGIVELTGWLEEQPAKDRTIVKLTLVGTIPLSVDAELEQLLEHQRDLFGAIELWERHTDLVVRPDDDDFADLTLTGFAREAVDELRTRALVDGPDGDVARDALALLVRLASGAGAGC
jgi:DNA repair exonuclease SbcCD nuclease subunit